MKSLEQLKGKNLQSFYGMIANDKIAVLRKIGFYELPMKDRIQFLERIGVFDVDVNQDPPTKVLMPDDPDLDYLKTNPEKQEKYDAAEKWVDVAFRGLIASGGITIKGIEGLENLEILKDKKQGAILTMNHFNPFDSFATGVALHDEGIDKSIYRVMREGNFTNFPEGPIADYFKYGKTLPLSQNTETMKMFSESLKKLLDEGNLVVVSPEQAMWENYQKPRPMKFGAYRWATQNDVPVIPMFVGHTEEGQASSFTIFIGKPIYPRKDKILSESAREMRDENYEFAKKMYEKYYGRELKYDIDPARYAKFKDKFSNFVKTTPGFDEMMERASKSKKDKKGPEIEEI